MSIEQTETVNTASPLAIAQELFAQKNFPQSEIYCRFAIASNPEDPKPQELLCQLTEAYEIPEDFELSEQSESTSVNHDKFLLIKAWGYGFWSEGHHLAGQFLLAELTQRKPLVLWGTNCLFRNPTDVDASTHFFKSLPTFQLEDIPTDATFFPAKWSRQTIFNENVNKWEGESSRIAVQHLFARPETVVVSDFFSTIASIIPWIGKSSKYYGLNETELYNCMFQQYLHPTDDLAARVENFYAQYMQNRPWVAVHVRGSDKVFENPLLAKTNETYYDFVDRIVELNPSIGVFLMTDTLSAIDIFKQRYGDRVLCTQVVRTESNIGVHLSGHNGVSIGEEVLLDTLIAVKCHYLIGNQESNVSLAISSLKEWPKGFAFLLGVNSARSENLFLHKRENR